MMSVEDAGYGLMEYPKPLSHDEVKAIRADFVRACETVGFESTPADVSVNDLIAVCDTALALMDRLRLAGWSLTPKEAEDGNIECSLVAISQLKETEIEIERRDAEIRRLDERIRRWEMRFDELAVERDQWKAKTERWIDAAIDVATRATLEAEK